jgi:hypothetical protein
MGAGLFLVGVSLLLGHQSVGLRYDLVEKKFGEIFAKSCGMSKFFANVFLRLILV